MVKGRDALKFRVAVPPTEEPVTLEEIKAQMRIDEDDDSLDEIITTNIVVARQWCEEYQNRAYITQTIELARDGWPYGGEIRLPRPPTQTVESLTYASSTGSVTTVSASSYILDNFSEPAFLVASDYWPASDLQATNAVKVAYVTGYGAPSQVPARIRQAILLLASHWVENGMCEPPCAVTSLLNLDRVTPV